MAVYLHHLLTDGGKGRRDDDMRAALIILRRVSGGGAATCSGRRPKASWYRAPLKLLGVMLVKSITSSARRGEG